MSKPTSKGRKRKPTDPLRPVPQDSGVAALRRVQANLKRHRAAVLKAACEGLPTEAEWSRTMARAEDADKKTCRSASSAKSAVTSSTCESGSALFACIL